MKKVWLLAILALALAPLAPGDAAMNSKLDVDFYGYVKLDAFYQNAYAMGNFITIVPPGNLHTNTPNWPWAAPKGPGQNLSKVGKGSRDGQANKERDAFGMTARQSRIGFLVKGPADGGISSLARVEMDFYGTGVTRTAGQDPEENKGLLYLRRAYVELKGEGWGVLAGNEWQVVSPIFPNLNNYPFGADVGNPGYRMPQIRFTGYLGENIILQVAAVNKLGDVDTLDIDTGRMWGAPTYEYGMIFKAEGAEIGYTGHYGFEEIRTARWDAITAKQVTDYYGTKVETYSHNIHLRVPMGEVFTLSGEYFQGANLDGMYMGAQGSGWVVTKDHKREPVKTSGGWVELATKLGDVVLVNVGYGVDDPEDKQLRGSVCEGDFVNIPGAVAPAMTSPYMGALGNTRPTKNEMYYSNVWFTINPAVKISLEWIQMISYYDNASKIKQGVDYNGDGKADTPIPMDYNGDLTMDPSFHKLNWEPGKVDRYNLAFWFYF